MSSEEVQPLRINKATPMSSPSKGNGAVGQRPLSELNPTAQRRNSPSYNSAAKKMALTRESSPFDSSPFSQSSPRAFWQGRDPTSPSRFGSENAALDREHSPSPKRSSIENLKRASRVTTSSMFAREHKYEYDPTSSPVVERPLAAGRPLSVQLQGNAFGGRGLDGLRKGQSHRRGESEGKVPMLSPAKFAADLKSEPEDGTSPVKEHQSPTRSSLSANGRYTAMPQAFDPELGTWSEDDEITVAPVRPLRRQNKSVTFDAAPPQVNEYEMATPDPSSVASGSRQSSYDSADEYNGDDSLDRGSAEDSFDASLEDANKTPVVLPGDWRYMSPENADTSLVETFEDPFNGGEAGPVPNAATGDTDDKSALARSGSLNSNGEHRPLPPVPDLRQSPERTRRESSSGLSATAERVSTHRFLPSPPRAPTISKSDILSMRDPAMSLEDRLRLMGLHHLPNPVESSDCDNKPHMAIQKDNEQGVQVHEDLEEDKVDDLPDLDNFTLPRISRESILRKVKSRNFEVEDVEDDFASARSSPDRSYGDLDPDVPIPSREASSNFDAEVAEMAVKQEYDGEEEVDVYSIPDMYSVSRSPSRTEDYPREGSVIRHDVDNDVPAEECDDASRYSPQSNAEESQQAHSNSTTEDEGPPTPKAMVEPTLASEKALKGKVDLMGLPDFTSSFDDFDFGLQSYMSEPTKEAVTTEPTSLAPELPAVQAFFERPKTPEDQLEASDIVDMAMEGEDRAGTPDSVIHRPAAIEPPPRDSPAIPDPIATIKAPGGKLKTRPSATPADMAALAAARRQVSSEYAPPVPMRSPNRLSMSVEPEDYLMGGSEVWSDSDNTETESKPKPDRRQSMKMKLDIPVGGDGDLSFGLEQEFKRVMETEKVAPFPPPPYAHFPAAAQAGAEHMCGQGFTPQSNLTNVYIPEQKGYLMRQNTKVVVASSRQFSNERPLMSPTSDVQPSLARDARATGSSPRKQSLERGQTWTTEPWNGKPRRKSVRTASGRKPPPPSGPVPPLPGQESNANALGTVVEDQLVDDGDDGTERGRLFVKVVGVKDLDLPLPKNERTWFQLTLDNGLHCVTTAWLELNRNAAIGQEFELVVLSDLEFQLTLQTKLTPPPKPSPTLPALSSPTKATKPQKSSAFSRLLTSPRKRREAERKAAEEAEALRQQHAAAAAAAKRASANPTAWDLLHELVAADGSFARAYVCLKSHEAQCYGRPLTVDVPCFNEWAVEDAMVASSVKSKRGGVVRRPPYRVGKLTLQLLYVPKPRGGKEEDMPKSLNAAIRELREAEENMGRCFEGVLSQQGGDCPYWRRRFFRLQGTKLTAYHESTRQPRCTMNLANARKLIDDRTALLQPDGGVAKGRRRSAFAEDEEGYMFVEEGFRIRFANGETIDFYADNAREKEGWMRVLSETVGKEGGTGKAWTEAVLARERAEGRGAAAAAAAAAAGAGAVAAPLQATRTNSVDVKRSAVPAREGSRSAPGSPVKGKRESMVAAATGGKRTSVSARRDQVRSMVF